MSDALSTGRHLQASAYYRRFLDKRFQRFTLTGLAPDDEPILLRHIYVPPVLTEKPVLDHVPELKLHEGGRSIIEWFEMARQAGEAPAVFFISGEAGSGKTTLATAIVVSLAGTAGDEFNRRLGQYIPFPILLRDAPVDCLGSLDDLIDWWLAIAKEDEPDLVPEDVRAFLDEGRGIILLDGLDELGSVERRERVLRWLHGHAWVVPHHEKSATNIVVVTARALGFDSPAGKGAEITASRLYIAPFSFDQIRTFLTHWFALRPMLRARQSERVESLISRLEKEPAMSQLRMLARRPAYLTSLAFVHGVRGALPHTRAALYDSLVDAYIDTLDRQRGILARPWDRQEKREVISYVAFFANTGASDPGHAAPDRRFSFSRAQLALAVTRGIQSGGARFRTIGLEDAPSLTEYFIARTGLFVETREGIYQFGHLSFQEYLAALFVLDRASGSTDKAAALESLLLNKLENPAWQEVALLALAIDVSRTRGTGHRAVLARLRPENTAHVSFLARVLAGEELPLEPNERHAWVLAWLMAAMVQDTSTNFGLVYFASNAEAIEAAWKAMCEAMLTDHSISSALRALLLTETTSSTPVERDPIVDIPEPEQATGPLAGPRQWATAVREPPEPLFGAGKLLAVMYPRSGTLAKLPLVRIAETVPLFSSSSTLPGAPLPTPIWEALNLWEYYDPRLRAAMRLRTSLTWICMDPSEDYQITFLARWGTHAPGSFERWQQEAFRRVLQVERVFHGAAVAFDSTGVPSALFEVATERSRVAREISDWLNRGIRHTLSFANKYDAPSRPLFLLRLAQADVLGPDSEDVYGSIRKRGIVAKDGPVHRALGTLPSRPVFSPADRMVVMSSVSLEVLNETLGPPGETLHRADVQALRRDLASPATMAAALASPLRERAAREWQELLDSPGSPLLMLDAALAREWSVLDLRTNAAARALEALAGSKPLPLWRGTHEGSPSG